MGNDIWMEFEVSKGVHSRERWQVIGLFGTLFSVFIIFLMVKLLDGPF